MSAIHDFGTGSNAAATDTATATSASSGQDSPPLRPLKEVESRHSHHSRSRASSHSSTDTDPLEPLEHALTPDLETEAEHVAREPITYTRTGTSIGSTASRPPDYEVVFEPDDPENPKNWPLWYRGWTIFVVSLSTWIVVLYSTSYTASIPGLVEEYHSSRVIATLGVTTYLLGLAAGSLIVAPMSELYGRQYVYLGCFTVSSLLIIPCALAKSLTTLIVVRFFGALFGAALIANSPGTVVDISDEEYRALAMSFYSIAPLNGPVTGPIIGGFVYQYLGWRWTNWIVLIIAGVGIALMFTLRETYAPTILQRKAARIRKETDDPRWWCRYDEKVSKVHLIKLNLSRPFVLSFTEPILWFFNLWISLIYGILYLCFVAYPIVFSQYRGWGPGVSGLAFVGIGIGTILAIISEPIFRRIINAHPKDPITGRVPPEATARVMTIGAILTPIGQLVFSWTCLPATIHWAIPIAFGIPFGAGNTISFIYGSNYLAGAYGIYAASALAGNAVMRSMFGGTLPLAGTSMYKAMSPQWAGTLCGLLELALIPIPIIFWRYGEKIRAKSPIIRQMREDQEKNESKRAKQLARLERKREREAAAAAAAAAGGNSEKSTGVLASEEQTEPRDIEKSA
ncbi:major facilitator superfamily transporter [Colletotrichum paranaense]|uniref:Major facilitator superfamily transporter n=2 Tax=Colletotrichum acutatum species complex TaxID=2707335 RepID=A0AAI9U6S5_9PEZI|nr:major facilitator superfamily transporter [Colletotrichum paranaense]KAK1451368.1 major facilitator superfamily transporter [Colletotrichum melonis]KAK1541397.1 major facilitator superfamily transporter [Colletotrichum paranaense]